ncbi:MAG: methylaspartate mutase subunit E [Pirellulales bacterium]|nr:methylaspartate mutase subunit E [Pirellulales bacterium]
MSTTITLEGSRNVTPDSKKIPAEQFHQIRRQVLESWPTGAGVNLDEALAYQRTIPEAKRFAQVISAAKAQGRLLMQPRAGVALVDEHVKLLKYLETEGGADLLPTTIDAYTRQNRYAEAAVGIEKSLSSGASMLNGFPAVNHGLEGCRTVTESVSKPVQVRHGTPDARLLAEITLAGGFTSFEGGGITYNIPYVKNVPIRKSLTDWQYVDRLCGLYTENGVPINRESFGPLTGTLVPPCIGHAIEIIEGLLALEQGVRSISLGYGQGGNLVQDVAAVMSLRTLAEEYFHRAGFADADFDLTTVFHQWMGGFPVDESKAFAVICWGTVAACLAGADKIIVKTPHEALGVPTKEANVQGLKATRQTINMLRDQKQSEAEAVGRETAIIEREVRCILDKVLQLGRDDVKEGTVAAFEAGVLDVAFAPSAFCQGKVLPMRDNEGCIRLFNVAGIPLDDDLIAYHHERLAERAKAEGRKICFQMITDDIYAISKGQLVGRPQ